MTRRPTALLLALLALLLPLAGFAETCDECLGGEVPGGCPPACSLCVCCAPGSAAVSLSPRVDRSPAPGLWIAEPVDAAGLSADPRDVFHVPKAS
ncbi:MAG TPA: hypothetical protein VF414_00205 [Thermoanaerobaculia bacterium]